MVHTSQELTLVVPSEVTLGALEQTAVDWKAYSAVHDGWNKEIKHSKPARIDMTQATWIDYSAAAQILAVVEGACRHGIDVEILLPSANANEDEHRRLRSHGLTNEEKSSLARRIRRRTGFLTFLSHLGFFGALQLSHLRGIAGVGSVTWTGKALEAGGDELPTTSEQSKKADRKGPPHRRLLPFTWIAAPSSDDVDTSLASDLARILRLSARDLTDAQSETIAREIVWELVENVWKHAGEGENLAFAPPAALVGAISVNTRNSRYAPKADDFPSEWQNYSKWLTTSRPSLFRLAIADSGVSIQRTLEESSERVGWSPSNSPTLISQTEETLFWSFAATSTRLNQNDRRRGIRGLARVKRLVRWYRGAVLIHSFDAEAGYSNPPGIPKVPYSRRKSGGLPGTLIDLHITGPSAIADPFRQSLMTDGAESLEVRTLELSQSTSLVDDAEAMTAGLGSPTLVLLCSATTLRELGKDWVAGKLADVAVAASTDCKRVVLAAPEVETQELIPFLKAYEDAWSDESSEVLTSLGIPTLPEPVMVLDSRLTPEWWGGDEQLRRRLYRLARAPEPDPAAMPSGTGQTESLFRSDWIGQTDGEAHLVPPVPRILDHLAGEACARLQTECERLRADSGSRGVWPTVSGDVVDAWVRVDQALQACGTWLPFIAVSLWGKLERAGIALDEIQMIVTASESVEAVGKYLGAQLGIHHHKLQGPRLPAVNNELQGRQLLILTDLIHTGQTIASDAIEILKQGAIIPAALCVVGGMEREESRLELLGRTIPVVSSVEVDIRRVSSLIGGERQIPRIRNTFDWDALSPVIGSDWPVVLRHVVRSSGRHFSAYLDVNSAIQSVFFRDNSRMIELHIDELSKALLRTTIDEAIIDLWYPDGDQLTELVAGNFASSLQRRTGRAIRRIAIPRNSRIERQSEARNVIVFDWGAMSGRTLTHLLLGAASTNCEIVDVFVLVSQIPDVERRLLANVVRVRRPPSLSDLQLRFDFGASQGVEEKSTVSIRFWEGIRLLLPAWDDDSVCDLCSSNRDLRRFEQDSMPFLIAEALASRLTAFAPTSRQDALEASQSDFFGTRADAETVRRAIIVHGAIRDVDSRNPWDVVELRRMLNAVRISNSSSSWMAVILAILLEPSLLKRSPLRVKSFRIEIAGICQRVVLEGKQYGLETGHFRQAAILWRMASKGEFLRNFPTAVKEHASDFEVVGDLMLGIFLYLGRTYHHDGLSLSRLIDQLLVSRSATAAALRSGEVVDGLLEAIDHLTTKAEFLLGTSETASEPVAIWAQLQRDYVTAIERHSGNSSAMEVVRELANGAFVEGVVARKVDNWPEYWSNAADDWKQVRKYLASTVLPRVRLLSNVLLSDYFRSTGLAGHKGVVLLERVAKGGDWESELATIGRRLEEFSSGVEIQRPQLQELQKFINEWHATFFLSIPGSESPLVSILKSCPGDLEAALDRPRSEELSRGGIHYNESPVPSELKAVFAPTGLLRDLFGQLVDNVNDHRNVGQEPSIDVRVTSSRYLAIVRFWNTASDPANNPGRGAGIAGYQKRLLPFGGSLKVLGASGVYSFGVEVRLCRWIVSEDSSHG